MEVSLERLIGVLCKEGVTEIEINPDNNRIRYLHYYKETDIYYLINEGKEIYCGAVTLPQTGELYAYHAWDNVLEKIEKKQKDGKSFVTEELEPYQSLILIFDEAGEEILRRPLSITEKEGREISVVPVYRFDITALIVEGENSIVIEVSTTLERERAAAKNQSYVEKLMRNKVLAPTGITGIVKVFEEG